MPVSPRDRAAQRVPGPAAVPGVKPVPRNPAPPARPAEPEATTAPDPILRTPPKSSGRGGPSAETFAYWDGVYKAVDAPPARLFADVAYLRKKRKFQDIEAAIQGYLRYRSKNAQPWMYESLALAIEVNQGSASRVKDALGFAARLAERSGNPNYILSVADLLYLRGYYDYAMTVQGKPVRVAVGPLIDRVAEQVPHRPQPILMSMNLARKTLDPKRMADAVERALALGWPGIDDDMRIEARRQAEELAEDLQAEGRQAEADALLARLPEAEGRDLVVRLTWAGPPRADADLDLVVDEPLGATVNHYNPRTVFGGALVKEGKPKSPEEVYVCPRAFDGDYTVRVETIYQDPAKAPLAQATLEIITREGMPGEHKEERTISLLKPAPIVVHLKGGRRKAVLPYVAPIPLAEVVIEPRPAAKAKAKAGPVSDPRRTATTIPPRTSSRAKVAP